MDPVFVRYVSAVPGRLVTRWDVAPAYLGARLATREELAAGADPIAWDAERVVPLTAAFVARFGRELNGALRRGDLVERSADDFALWQMIEADREARRIDPAPTPNLTETE